MKHLFVFVYDLLDTRNELLFLRPNLIKEKWRQHWLQHTSSYFKARHTSTAMVWCWYYGIMPLFYGIDVIHKNREEWVRESIITPVFLFKIHRSKANWTCQINPISSSTSNENDKEWNYLWVVMLFRLSSCMLSYASFMDVKLEWE